MNILMLTSSFPRYEGDYCGPWILEYCREMIRQGHSVTVLAPAVSGVSNDALSNGNLTVKRFDYWPLKEYQKLAHPPGIIPQLKSNPFRYILIPSFIFCFYRAAACSLKSEKFDVVHSQWAIPAGYIGYLLAKSLCLPHVITSQGAEFFLSRRHVFSYFTRKALSGSNALLAVSEQMRQRSVNYGSDLSRTMVVPNAVNTEFFFPSHSNKFREQHGIKESTHIVLTVRRLVPEKRVKDVILAVMHMPKELDVRFVIGGDGPERDSLVKMVKDNGLEDQVTFIGFVDNSNLPFIYAAADSYVLSSEQEGLSLSMLEAMSSGLVVISTDSTGGKEAITQSINGFLYSVGDYMELTNILTCVLSLSRDERSAIGENARKKVIEKYSVVKMVNTWIRVYRGLIPVSALNSKRNRKSAILNLLLEHSNSKNRNK